MYLTTSQFCCCQSTSYFRHLESISSIHVEKREMIEHLRSTPPQGKIITCEPDVSQGLQFTRRDDMYINNPTLRLGVIFVVQSSIGIERSYHLKKDHFYGGSHM